MPLTDESHRPQTHWRQTWIDDFTDWDDVAECLHGDWELVRDQATGAEVLRGPDFLAVLEHDALRARHRRALHRSGFRSYQLRARRCWLWVVPSESAVTPAQAGPAFAARLRREREVGALLSTRAIHVLREVFRTPIGDVVVMLAPPDEEQLS